MLPLGSLLASVVQVLFDLYTVPGSLSNKRHADTVLFSTTSYSQNSLNFPSADRQDAPIYKLPPELIQHLSSGLFGLFGSLHLYRRHRNSYLGYEEPECFRDSGIVLYGVELLSLCFGRSAGHESPSLWRKPWELDQRHTV